MSDEGSSADRLARALAAQWWVDDVTIDGVTGDVELSTSAPPDLRGVYEVIERGGEGAGTVTIDGPSGAWAVHYADGEVRDVSRVGGTYTVNRLSRLERVFHGLAVFGVYLLYATAITIPAAFVMTTPIDLVGVGPVVGIGTMLLVGVGCVIGGMGLFLAVPGLTSGAATAEPGRDVPGFDALSPADRAALVAVDDAKSEREVTALLRERQALGLVGAFGFAAYVGLVGWLNAGAVGLLVATGLFPLRSVLQLASAWHLLGRVEPLDDPYVDELLSGIRATAGSGVDPTVVGVGDPDAPVHGTAAMAVPSLDRIFVPRADVEKLHRDELEAILAHEYEHVRAHAPVGLVLLHAGLVLVPGLALLASGATPSPLVLGLGLAGYFGAVRAALSLVRRRWEFEADAFASEVASPLGLAFALVRVTDRPVIDGADTGRRSGPTGELFGTHPYPHRRFARLVRAATERPE